MSAWLEACSYRCYSPRRWFRSRTWGSSDGGSRWRRQQMRWFSQWFFSGFLACFWRWGGSLMSSSAPSSLLRYITFPRAWNIWRLGSLPPIDAKSVWIFFLVFYNFISSKQLFLFSRVKYIRRHLFCINVLHTEVNLLFLKWCFFFMLHIKTN